MYNRSLHWFAVLLAVCTLFLVIAGASVTSNQAGLSVPDWPLSYGKVMPPMVGGVFYEHGHRMIATTVGFLTVILAIWLWRSEPRRWMKGVGLAALGAVIVQGVLGGLTVKFLLPKPVSISHACLAQLFFSTTVAIAVWTSRSWVEGPRLIEDNGWPSLRVLATTVPVVILAQLALGAAYRHKAITVMPHIVGAMVVTGANLLAAITILISHPKHGALRKSALALLGVTFLQVMLGIGAYLARVSAADDSQVTLAGVAFTVAHVALGALTMASGVVLSILTIRNVRRPVALELRPEGLAVS